MKFIYTKELKKKGQKVVDQEGHQVYIYNGHPGGGLAGIPNLCTREMAEAEGEMANQHIKAAIKSKLMVPMTPAQVDQRIKAEALAAAAKKAPPPVATGGSKTDPPPTDGGEGNESSDPPAEGEEGDK